MLEAPDLEVVSSYLRKHYLNMRVNSVRYEEAHEHVAVLRGTTLIDVKTHGKFIYCVWETEQLVPATPVQEPTPTEEVPSSSAEEEVGATEEEIPTVEGDTPTVEEEVPTMMKKLLYSQINLASQGRIYDTAKYTQRDGHYFTLHFTTGNLSFFDHLGTASMSITEAITQPSGKCIMSGKLTAEDLETYCERKKGSIATRLLLQERVVGIGTILCTEILHAAGIHPKTTIPTLTRTQKDDLLRAMNTVSIDMALCGSYRSTRPISPDGSPGFYSPQIYGSKDKSHVYRVGGTVFYTEVAVPED